MGGEGSPLYMHRSRAKTRQDRDSAHRCAQTRTDVCTALSKGSDAKPEERTEPVDTLRDAPGAACCVEYTAEAEYGLKLFRPDSAAERFYLLDRAAGHLVTAKSVYVASYRPDRIQQTDLMTGEPRSVWLVSPSRQSFIF